MPPSTPAGPSLLLPAAGAETAPRGPGRARPSRTPRFGRQLVIFLLLTSALLVAVAAASGDRGWFDVRRQRAQLSRLRAEVAGLREENAGLLAEVRGLRTDPFVLEAIAREKLGLAKPGEIVFTFSKESPTVRSAPPPVPPPR